VVANSSMSMSVWRLAALARRRGGSRLLESRWLSSSSGTSSGGGGIPYTSLTVGIPKEIAPLERRVAATPESVLRLTGPGFRVIVEDHAGAASYFSNADYEAAGATIVPSVYDKADIILKVCMYVFDKRDV
jgi:H+-translocating NAD(P) transhydrogenase